MTTKVIGIYERGLIRPLKKLPFPNHQRLELRIEIPKSITQSTRAIIRIRKHLGRVVAESAQLSTLGSH